MSLTERGTKQVQCPQCHGTDVEQIFTTFFAKTSKKS
jgi:hypothetical protein